MEGKLRLICKMNKKFKKLSSLYLFLHFAFDHIQPHLFFLKTMFRLTLICFL